MITPWLAWVLTVAGFLGLSVGTYLVGYHRGYLAGLGDRLETMPGNPRWMPESEADFMSELLERERLKPEPPKKYRREP